MRHKSGSFRDFLRIFLLPALPVLATQAAASSLPGPVLVLFIDASVSPSIVGQLDRVYDLGS